MNIANYCEIKNKIGAPKAVKLPESRAMSAPELWALIDSASNKGQMCSVFRQLLNSHGLLANNCPQEIRDKLDKMAL